PEVLAWAEKGKPFIPWAAKTEDLPQAEIPSFPGAEGGGMYSFGGRGGKVYVVTSLEDSGAGTFREALEAAGPRIVVFNVAGIIKLKDRIRVRAPYITIDGSRAPGDGVCMYGDFTFVNNVLFNYVHRTVDGGDHMSMFNIINNYLKPGPATPDNEVRYRVLKPESERSKTVKDHFGKAYVAGNIVEGNEK